MATEPRMTIVERIVSSDRRDQPASTCSGRGQLEEVVSGGHQAELAADFGQAPEQELAELPGALDLPEHGFHGDLAQAVATAVARALEPGPHRREQRADGQPAR